MSDCSDHEVDAFEQYIGYNGVSDGSGNNYATTTLVVVDIRAATNKAVLFSTQYGLCWIPRSQILKFKKNEIIIPYWLKSRLSIIHDNPS